MIEDVQIAGICLKHHTLLMQPSAPVKATNRSGIVWQVDFSDAVCPGPEDEVTGSDCEDAWKVVVL